MFLSFTFLYRGPNGTPFHPHISKEVNQIVIWNGVVVLCIFAVPLFYGMCRGYSIVGAVSENMSGWSTKR